MTRVIPLTADQQTTYPNSLTAPASTSASGLQGGASDRQRRGFRPLGGASGCRGWLVGKLRQLLLGTAGRTMAANLSRNGPALQEAYGLVVDEKSPTDWWAAGREYWGRRRSGCRGRRAPHLLSLRQRGAVTLPGRRAPPGGAPGRILGSLVPAGPDFPGERDLCSPSPRRAFAGVQVPGWGQELALEADKKPRVLGPCFTANMVVRTSLSLSCVRVIGR